MTRPGLRLRAGEACCSAASGQKISRSGERRPGRKTGRRPAVSPRHSGRIGSRRTPPARRAGRARWRCIGIYPPRGPPRHAARSGPGWPARRRPGGRALVRLGGRDLLGRELSGFGWCAEREVGEGDVGAPRRGCRARAVQAGDSPCHKAKPPSRTVQPGGRYPAASVRQARPPYFCRSVAWTVGARWRETGLCRPQRPVRRPSGQSAVHRMPRACRQGYATAARA